MKMVVIGGGVIGLSCAWRLGAGGARVTVLERRRCGAGATLASLGALWPPSALARGPLQQWHRECLRRFAGFAAEAERASAMPVPMKRGGRLEILNSVAAAERARQEAEAACGEWSGWPTGEGPPIPPAPTTPPDKSTTLDSPPPTPARSNR